MTPEDLWRISGERPLERTADDAIDLRVTRVWHRGASVIHVRATGDHATLRVFTVDRFAQPSGASDTRDEARTLEPEEWRRLLGLLRVVDFGAPSPTPEQWMALVGEVDDVVELRQHARYDRPEMFFRLEGADELLRALFELAAPAFRASTR